MSDKNQIVFGGATQTGKSSFADDWSALLRSAADKKVLGFMFGMPRGDLVVQANPDPDELEVAADWLEEQGDLVTAKMLRHVLSKNIARLIGLLEFTPFKGALTELKIRRWKNMNGIYPVLAIGVHKEFFHLTSQPLVSTGELKQLNSEARVASDR